MTVLIPSPLRSYTGNEARVEVNVERPTVGELLQALDRRFPGLRFRIVSEQDRIREHIRIFVNEDPVTELHHTVQSNDVVHIICALSGG